MFFDIQMVKLSVFEVREFSRRNSKKKQDLDNDSEHCFCLSIPSENLYSAASKKQGFYLQIMAWSFSLFFPTAVEKLEPSAIDNWSSGQCSTELPHMDSIQIRAQSGANQHLGMWHVAVEWPGVSLSQGRTWRAGGECWWNTGGEKAWENAISVQKYLKGKRMRAKCLSVVPSEKTWGHGHKEKHGSLVLSTRKHFNVRDTEPWHRLPTLGHIQNPPGNVPETAASPCWPCCKQRGWTDQCPDVPQPLILSLGRISSMGMSWESLCQHTGAQPSSWWAGAVLQPCCAPERGCAAQAQHFRAASGLETQLVPRLCCQTQLERAEVSKGQVHIASLS